VIDWAGAVITPANTIAAPAADVMNVFISCLSSRPLAVEFSLARPNAQVQIESITLRLRAPR
jgi:hypothetical protein